MSKESRKKVLCNTLKAAWEEAFSRRSFSVKEKENAGDLLTEVDLAVSEMIKEAIEAGFPDERVLCEESPGSHDLVNDNTWQGWVLDPIDGTNNFARGIPYWGISLAFVRGREVLLGGIINAQGDLYTAEQGLGALGPEGERLQISKKSCFDAGCRVVTSNNTDYKETLLSLGRYERLPAAWVDCLGSATAIMVDVASGKLDLYHHRGLKPWDNPAGFLLIREAGGVVFDFAGGDADWRSADAICGPEALVHSFLKVAEEQTPSQNDL